MNVLMVIEHMSLGGDDLSTHLAGKMSLNLVIVMMGHISVYTK